LNYGPLIFLATFFAMASSWFGLVLAPQIQLGRLQQTNAVPGGPLYPVARPGLAQQGRDVYRANGCAACHSQQVGQTGTVFEVVLSDAGTNQAATLAALCSNNPALSETGAKAILSALPQTVLTTSNKAPAESAVKALAVGGAKTALAVVPLGPDITRGWGKRHSVAEDFLYDYPVMLGSQRVGPDLADVGARLPDRNWHLRHLLSPATETKGSTMPPYRFLFESRKLKGAPSAEAVWVSPGKDYEMVPRPEAIALAAYLVSLRADAPLFTAPYAPAAASAFPSSAGTPAGATATNAAPATAPAK
jgi:cbb3-type cytochrome oxidase cytochrome c subunit